MLKEIIDKFYTDRQKDKEQHRFYITDAGKCSRAIFLKFKKAPREEIEARVLRMFDHGDHIHKLIMKPLLSTRDIHVVASEVDIPPLELISGRADAVLSNGKELFVLDIKSMNSMIFRNLAEPKEENINQVQLYLHFFDIKKGILLYVNKDNQDLKEFVINYDKKRSELLIEDLMHLKKKIDLDVVPERIPTHPKDWQCQYCQFRELCILVGKDEVNWKAFQAKINSLAEINGSKPPKKKTGTA